MPLNLRDPRVLAAAGGALLLLLVVIWGMSCSHRATATQAKLDALSTQLADSDSTLATQRHLTEANETLAGKRADERDKLAAQVRQLTQELTTVRAAAKQASTAQDEAEKAREAAARQAEIAQADRAKAVLDRDHQYQQWRTAQDRYDELMKSYQQLKEQVPPKDTAAKP